MSYSVAKLLLKHAGTEAERQEAVRKAIQLKMPLAQIEEYLDWLENVQSLANSTHRSDSDDQVESDVGVGPPASGFFKT